MIAEYKCLFGISTRVEGLTPGETEVAYGKDHSFLVICGKDGRTFWFEFIKMERIYRTPEIPRFTKQDAEDQMKAHSHLPITNAVTFGDILKTRAIYALTPLEEAFYKTWTWGRFVTLGDNNHKVCKETITRYPFVPNISLDDPKYCPRRQCGHRVSRRSFKQLEEIAKQRNL
jgi:hypothetical protein